MSSRRVVIDQTTPRSSADSVSSRQSYRPSYAQDQGYSDGYGYSKSYRPSYSHDLDYGDGYGYSYSYGNSNGNGNDYGYGDGASRSSRRSGSESLMAYEPQGRQTPSASIEQTDANVLSQKGSSTSNMGYGGSKSNGGYSSSNNRSQNPAYEFVRSPQATGSRHSTSGGPRENPHGYEKVIRRTTKGSEIVTYNYGVASSDSSGRR
ncbi:MAG: hypothetical protein M1837_003272 [Sclerophora amabilis]|nr:MAG: hypothetical protein M1837_003272 [Sclerophora amabilis]